MGSSGVDPSRLIRVKWIASVFANCDDQRVKGAVRPFGARKGTFTRRSDYRSSGRAIRSAANARRFTAPIR
jgi:hypothetical protein